MVQRIGFVLLALLGIGLSIFMIYLGSRKPPVEDILFPLPNPPFEHHVAGEGIIESVFQNIFIGVPFPELIMEVYANVGDIVQQGSPLFKLDTRQFEAQLTTALQEEKLARVDYEKQRTNLSFYNSLHDTAAVSKEAYADTLYALQAAEQRINVAQARAREAETLIQRALVRAPITGEILQSNIRIGEYANVNPFTAKPLMIFGDTRYYHIRVSIDEENAWRVVPGAPGVAYVRGNYAIEIPITFVHIEPYVIPKTSLTGSNRERVDTRVLEVVYACPKDDYPIYYGQLLDIYLEALPHALVTPS